MPTDEQERPTPDSGMVEQAKDALSPLVNEDMGADMRDAWLTDLATAALEAAGIEELRKANEELRMAVIGARATLRSNLERVENLRTKAGKADALRDVAEATLGLLDDMFEARAAFSRE